MDEQPQLESAERAVRDLMILRVNLCGKWWYVVVCGGKAKVVECIYCRLKKIAIGSLAVVMPLGGPMWLGEMVIILGVVGETVGGHEIYRVYGRSIGEGRLIGYSLDVVYDVV